MKRIKWFALLLMAVVFVSMTACGSSEETSNGEKRKETATESVESFGIERGTVTDGTYENKTFGFRCTLDDTWVLGTEEEILALNGIVGEVVEDEEVKEILNSAQTFYDLYAYKTDGSIDNINMIVENLSLVNKLSLSEKEYVEAATAQLDAFATSAGMENLVWTLGECAFAGENRFFVDMEYDLDGVHICQRQIYIKADGVMAVLTFSSGDSARLLPMFEAFSAI